MEKQKFARVFLNAALVFALSGASFGAFAATSSPNVSLGKNLYVAGAVNSNWKPEVYTDGKLDFNQVSSVSDFALNVGEGPTKVTNLGLAKNMSTRQAASIPWMHRRASRISR